MRVWSLKPRSRRPRRSRRRFLNGKMVDSPVIERARLVPPASELSGIREE